MSSLKDLASLIMVPSLYKDGELHTVKPLADENIIVHPDATDNNDGFDGSTPSTSSNFTFSRGSNLAATRVDVNGLIEKGRENLVLQGSDISTQSGSWSANQGGVTTQNAATSPIGTNTASQITANGSNTYSGVRDAGIVMGALRYTYSVYLKAQSGTPDIRLTCYDGVTFHQQDFSITTEWERYSITFTPTAGTHNIYITSQQAVSWYAWGAQFELGLVATDYIETGASTAQAGILEDMPRLDYSGGASCPSLLLEPQRSNQNNHSEYFGGWTANATITANAGISPEGVQNAYNIASNSGVGNGILKIMGVLSSTQYVCSLYVKSAGATTGKLRLFDGSTGASTTTTFTPTSEWQRVEVTRTSGSSTFQFRVDIHSNDGDLLIYGAQLEAGSYPTSYIPTYGTSQTRSKEGANLTGLSGVFGSSSSTTFIEIDIPPSGSLSPTGVWTLTAATDTSNFISVCQFDGGITTPRIALYIGGVAIIDQYLSTPLSAGTHKVCLAYEDGRQKLFIDGVEELSLTASFNYVEFTKLSINDAAWALGNNGGPYSNKQALVFPTALTDSECIALTTL